MIALVLIYVTLVKGLNRQKRLLVSYESLDVYKWNILTSVERWLRGYCFVNDAVRLILKTTVLYVEIKCQLDATEVFIADLIVCSTCFGRHYAHHQELKSIIQWLLPVVFRAVGYVSGYVSGLQDAAASCKPDT